MLQLVIILYLNKFLNKLFSIRTVSADNKIFTKVNLFGFEFRYRNLKKEYDIINDRLEATNNTVAYLLGKTEELTNENRLLRVIIDRSIDIKKVPPAKGNLRKVQLIKTKLLELTSCILRKNNIGFWPEYGTLIGAVRHNGFIPWDDDIDIALLKEDYLKLPQAFEDLIMDNKDFEFSYEL